MKKIKLICVLILIALMMVGCSPSLKESTDRISTPKNNQIPVSGTWKVANVIDKDFSEDSTSNEEWLDKTIEFSEEYMTLVDNYIKNPGYQVKRVNGKEYIFYTQKTFLIDFSIPDGDIEVITVIDRDKNFCEIIKISDSELILSTSNYNLDLIKISDEVSNVFIAQEEEKESISSNYVINKESKLIRSGVLFGVRSNNTDGYSYKTLWIGFKNKRMDPILEVEGIIFPRRSGFWKIETVTNMEDNRIEDKLYAFNISKETVNESRKLIQIDFSNWAGRTGKIQKRIDYIGNDYVSIQVSGEGSYEYSDKMWQENILQILPIDSLPNDKNIKITDLSGEESLGAIELGMQNTMTQLNIEESDLLNKHKLLDSFGLVRKMGHWFFKGRINYILDNEFHYADYNINILPPSKLVIYDDLNISWTHIKNKVPGAIDAFTSPYGEIVLIVTKSEIVVYGVDRGEIEDSPMGRIPLEDNETIIMAEWATGDYVDNWSKTLSGLKNGE